MILSLLIPVVALACLFMLADLALTWLRRRVRRAAIPVSNDAAAEEERGEHDGEAA